MPKSTAACHITLWLGALSSPTSRPFALQALSGIVRLRYKSALLIGRIFTTNHFGALCLQGFNGSCAVKAVCGVPHFFVPGSFPKGLILSSGHIMVGIRASIASAHLPEALPELALDVFHHAHIGFRASRCRPRGSERAVIPRYSPSRVVAAVVFVKPARAEFADSFGLANVALPP